MKPAEFMQSWIGKALIAAALFAAGYYYPLFRLVDPAVSPAPVASAPSAAAASSAAPSR